MASVEDVSGLTQGQRDLLTHVERLLMAPCCYTQTIDVHTSEIAETMRREVTQMVRQGQTGADIFSHYKAGYGEQILAVPDGRLGTTAFVIPPTVAALATGALTYVLYRFHARKSALMASNNGAVTKTCADVTCTSEQAEALRSRIRAETAF